MSDGLNFQRFLDGVVDAFRARDFEAFEARMGLPLTVFSFEGTAVVTGAEDLRHYFAMYLQNLDRAGVTHQIRVATSFYQIGPSLAACTYDTHLFRGGQRVIEPFASATTLRQHDGRWQVVSLMSAIPHARSWFRDHAIEASAVPRAGPAGDPPPAAPRAGPRGGAGR